MERRSWPWKRKSSDKFSAEKAAAILDSAGAALSQAKSQVDQDNYKKPNYVQISVESYSHLTGLEDQVKTYEEQVQTLEEQIKELNDNLSAANSEITTKENLVKQHMKVAEEAVSGWEKAEAEALALKSHLESVTLEKLAAEDRASHLDDALKECMRQIRNLKEEHDKNLHEVVLSKTKQCEKIMHEFEAKIVSLDQELLRSAADNAALSRSLQERSNMLIKISEEKSKAEADIELLRSDIESCEKEINSLKYEIHVVSKELEIRNEEKNMSARSAEAANKQHMEGVKKIAKLEAECQRLRGLVRKKLPGPAALAQMKMEVESLGRDYGEPRLKRSPGRPPSPYLSPMPEFSLENVQKFHKENEFLTERLLTMEEETKMLKEALAKRNHELQVSRNMCAKTASRLQILETQLQISNQDRSSVKPIIQIPGDGSVSHNASNPPSLTSMSEDGNEEERSCAESWATALISELSQFKKGENIEKPVKADVASHLELMDDFLEMEKLANNSDRSISISDGSVIKGPDTSCNSALEETTRGKDSDSSPTGACSDVEASSASHESGTKMTLMKKLQSRISSIFDSGANEDEVDNTLNDIKQLLQEAHDTLHQHSMSYFSDKNQCSDALSNGKTCPEDTTVPGKKDLHWMGDAKPANGANQTLSKEMEASIIQIHEFVLLLGKEAMTVRDLSVGGDGLDRKIEEFSVTFHKVLNNDANLFNFVLDLSLVLDKARVLKFNILGYKGVESEVGSPDCVDKVALPEHKVIQRDASRERYENGCRNIMGLIPNPDIADDNGGSDYEISNSLKISLEDYEKLRSEKDKMARDLASATENLDITKTQLQELEQLLAEMKTQLAASQNSYSLAETQLKCMAESYRSLEACAQELEAEIKNLQAKLESQDNELQEEKRGHQDALARCKDLEERLLRNESCLSRGDADKSKQEELTAAAEKLAECQETIFLLGKQLKALHPNSELTNPQQNERTQKEDETIVGGTNLQGMVQAEMDDVSMTSLQRPGDESPLHPHDFLGSPSESEASFLRSPVNSKRPKHRPTLSTSSSSSSGPTPEKQQRGFSRFFSSKGKNSQ